MEYILCRAMEISRLSHEDYSKLQSKEQSLGRGLLPAEIQAIFKLGPLKEHYGIPVDQEGVQSIHNQRLRSEFRKAGLMPKMGDINMYSVNYFHTNYDQRVKTACDQLDIDLMYRGAKALKKRFSDELVD